MLLGNCEFRDGDSDGSFVEADTDGKLVGFRLDNEGNIDGATVGLDDSNIVGVLVGNKDGFLLES